MNRTYSSEAARAKKHVCLARQIFNVGTSKDQAIVGNVNATTGGVVGATSITVAGFSAAESAVLDTPCFFNSGEVATATVGAAGALVGDYEIPLTASSLTAAEVLLVRRGMTVKITSNATDYFYCVVRVDTTELIIDRPLEYAATSADEISFIDDTAYCVNTITKTSGLITTLEFYPPLVTALSSSEAIVFGRGHAFLGHLTQDESYNKDMSYTTNTRKNEGGEDCDSNTTVDSQMLTIGLCNNNTYADYLFGGMLCYKSSSDKVKEVLDPAQSGFIRQRYYDIVLGAVDTTEQFFTDLDSEIGFRRCQYTPDTISKNGVPSNISRVYTPMFTVYDPEVTYYSGKDYEGEPVPIT
jgi:hypothetical protein